MTDAANAKAAGVPLSRVFPLEILPTDRFTPREGARTLHNRLIVGDLSITGSPDLTKPVTSTSSAFELDEPAETRIDVDLWASPEAVFEVPGLGGISLVLGGPDALTVQLVVKEDGWTAGLFSGVRLRFPRDWLRPVVREDGKWVDDPDREYVELGFGAGVTVDHEFNVSFPVANEFAIGPAMIGDTGLVIEGTVAVDLSESSGLAASQDIGLPPEWRGVVFLDGTKLHLPDDVDVPDAPDALVLKDFHIGGGGITGTAGAEWTSNPPTGELFGMGFELREVGIEFRETALVGASITGTSTLPFFEEPVDVSVGIAGDGSITAGLADDDEDGLVDVDHEAFGLVVDGVEFSTADVPSVTLSGTLTPKLIPDAPAVRIEALTVDADGNVHVDGGWLEIPDQYSIDFFGFTFEVTAVGMGRNDDGSKWIGLNGGIRFVSDFEAGVSVDGLRITWSDDQSPKVSFEGVGVELEVPDALRFKGYVSYRERTLPDDDVDHRFEGDISLDLLALELSIDGKLVVGTREEDGREFTYFAIYLGADLPVGIPLVSTGLSIYGFAGLYAQNMSPALQTGEKWFSREGDVESWYHRSPTGAIEFSGTPSKWPAREGDFALGAGVTIGTDDNGYTFSGNLMLVIAFPGPVVMLNGEANILTKRSELGDREPNFSALAVFDGRAGTFTFGLDAQYEFDEESALIEIGASISAYYHLNDPTAWYIYIGREALDKRVQSTVFKLFTSRSYLMLDPRRLALGAWYGIDESYSFGPFGLDVAAWASGDAALSFQPPHFSATIQAEGSIRARVFGFSRGLGLEAKIAAEVFTPFHLLGEFKARVELVWPLPDLEETVELEWGPTKEIPDVPEPLSEVAIGHELATTTWPLTLTEKQIPPADAPVVPLDGRPQLTFTTSVHDDGMIDENAPVVVPEYVRIGDPAANEGPVEVRYGLADVSIERPTDDGWEAVPDVYGSWAPVATLPERDRTVGADPPMATTKLTLFTPNPFEYVRHTSGAWAESMAERTGRYPCPPAYDCYDFVGRSLAEFAIEDSVDDDGETALVDITPTGIDDWPRFRQTIQVVGEQEDEEVTLPGTPDGVDVTDVDADGTLRPALTIGFLPGEGTIVQEGIVIQGLNIWLPEPRRSVAVEVNVDKYCDLVGLLGLDSDGVPVIERRESPNPLGVDRLVITSRAGTFERVTILTGYADAITEWTVNHDPGIGDVALFSVCAATTDLSDVGALVGSRVEGVRDKVARLGDEGEVFDAHTTYRIGVTTTTHARGVGDFDWYDEQPPPTTSYAYFRTEGPPRLADLSVPETQFDPDPDPDSEPPEFDSGLDDLARYVRGTVPETLPARGERPPLPRPVYRAYDVGVRFNRSYVDRLYWSAGRDLALTLFDRNNEPARTPDGRLRVAANQWGEATELLLDVAERHWLRAIEHADCVGIDEAVVARDDVLDATIGLGALDPDEVYEARLVPRLLRDPFGDTAYYGGLGTPPWTVHDRGAPGTWVVEGHETLTGPLSEPEGSGVRLWIEGPNAPSDTEPPLVTADLSGVTDGDVVWFSAQSGAKTFRITGVDATAGAVEIDGTPSFDRSRWLIPGRGEVRQTATTGGDYSLWVRDATEASSPETWTDYRAATVITLDASDSTAGLVVRYDDADGAHLRYVLDGDADERRLVLDDGSESTALRTVERPVTTGRPYAVEVDVVGDTVRVFEDDEPVFAATLDGLSDGTVALLADGPATFGEVRVDDLSADAPVAYRFAFTTSRFANAAHQFGSYADETWAVAATAPVDPSPRVALADAEAPATDDEGRAFEAALSALDRPRRTLDRIEAAVVRRNGTARALLIESPEPIDWTRTSLDVSFAPQALPTATPPRGVKITDVTYGADEEVGVLAIDDTDLTDHRIEFRRDGAGYAPTRIGSVFVDSMDGDGLADYRLPGQGAWRRADDRITADVSGADSTLLADATVPSTAVWSVAFDERTVETVGLAFRVDGDTGYRFTIGPTGRRLLQYQGATETTLWADDAVESPDGTDGAPLVIRVEARDEQLWVYLDDVPVCVVADPDDADGTFGPYVDGTGQAVVGEVGAHERVSRSVLYADTFVDDSLPGWQAVDEPPETTQHSDWRVTDESLVQQSNIYGFHGAPYGAPGTYLVTEETFTDGRFVARLRSDDDDAIGVMVRVRDDENYYRFSMDSERSFRRFDRQADGITVPLWRDETAFDPGREYVLTIECQGDRFTGYLDGVELFSVWDDTHPEGGVALYCRANVAATFHDSHVFAAADQWVPYYEFTASDVHPAGTQLRLYTGDAPSRTGAGIIPLSTDETPRLPLTGAFVRLVGSDLVRHERWIPPEAAFSGVTGVRLSRSSDGTGVFVFPDGPLQQGTYRTDLLYRRQGTPTLFQAGDDSTERSSLDVVIDE